MAVSKRIVMHFSKKVVESPIVCQLAKDFDLDFNIIKASISPEEEGLLILDLSGEQAEYDRGIRFLVDTGVRIESIDQSVTRDNKRCIDCGACVTVCPTGAFEVDPVTRLVNFDNEKCIACELCIKACPSRAMGVHF